jgi:hypothetical protein
MVAFPLNRLTFFSSNRKKKQTFFTTRHVTDSGKDITGRQTGTLFRKAHLKFLAVGEGVFRATGVKPLNPRVLSEKASCLLSQQARRQHKR